MTAALEGGGSRRGYRNGVPKQREKYVMNRILATSAVLIAAAVFATPHSANAGEGRYQAVALSSGFWIVIDTKTGRTRTCETFFGENPPVCTPWSEE